MGIHDWNFVDLGMPSVGRECLLLEGIPLHAENSRPKRRVVYLPGSTGSEQERQCAMLGCRFLLAGKLCVEDEAVVGDGDAR